MVTVLNVATYLGLLTWIGAILASSGWSGLDALLLAGFAIGLPWTVLGFWNAAIGYWLLRNTSNGLARVAPFAKAAEGRSAPLHIKTAILLTLRNENPSRAFQRLSVMCQSIEATGQGKAFSYFILSDTSDPVIGIEEEALAEAFAVEASSRRTVYRRRTDNSGYKAGNIRDFGRRWGKTVELMLVLDADSLMTGETIVRMVRIMQTYPRLGILQSLIIGMPSKSAFARIFQFGMRQGMRPYTMGYAWWTADCGAYWGHNALIRTKPFFDECDLPVLPSDKLLGGPILSHDQVEATFMRRAGYEVRIWPEEAGSWEENPPTILDFIRRDMRWCQGNLQYIHLLLEKGLLPTSRFQLIWAILMFLSIPAWTVIIALLPFIAHEIKSSAQAFPVTLAMALYVVFMTMHLAPKLAGFFNILVNRDRRARYGGALRFLCGTAIELVFSFLLGAVTTLCTTIFMAGLLFRRTITWSGQARDAHSLEWGTAVRRLWPQTVFGLALTGTIGAISPTTLLFSLPLTIGYAVAIPFAVWTSRPALGEWMARRGICTLPEEHETVEEIERTKGPATGPVAVVKEIQDT
ncbi:glucan biosynthesis glucosyltransferase H [Microvirga aerophila]|uniref:Glucans biosynthesis glucosyltransferase H n=2 Tax=Microvirga aerophila TaxID=670291 RepID=A0A512BSK6_9HYPH|nr:glucan biosynthesis glucosyltransferase H [Microvirga aerophila]